MKKRNSLLLSGLLLAFVFANSGYSQNNPDPGTKKEYTVNDVTFTMVYCPPGSFRMGSPENEALRARDETQRKVTLSKGFWMLESEVTQELYQAIMGGNASHFKGSQLPVERVSWFDAVKFCNKLSVAAELTPYYSINNETVKKNSKADGFRLPTEAEWEYAARAGTTTPFYYGTKLDSTLANFDGNYPYGDASKGVYRERTTNVKSFNPNAWGLYDMHGNVWEWCWDWYGQYSGDAVDPMGPQSGSRRVRRGGSWRVSSDFCRSAKRNYDRPDFRFVYLGFRFSRTQ